LSTGFVETEVTVIFKKTQYR